MRCVVVLLLLILSPCIVEAKQLDVWLGTKTSPSGARGIYYVGFDDETGKLSPARLVAEVTQPGFLALHPTLPVLYATGDGGVLAFRIERNSGGPSLRPLSRQMANKADGATHLSVDHTGRVLLVAHYGSGVIATFPIAGNGAIEPLATQINHREASGVVAGRQDGPHPHWIGLSPDNRFAFVPDLGADKVFIYQLDAATAKLASHGSAATPPGGGPRHFKFHPTGLRAYVVNELAMSLTAFDYDTQAGVLTPTQTIATLSGEQIAGESFNSGSEIRVHPSGKFVYSANRGHDSITAFAIDDESGQLSLIETEPIRGSWPRNFNLDPSGRWLLAAGRDSNTLAVFEIDRQTGALRYTRRSTMVPGPICVVFGNRDD